MVAADTRVALAVSHNEWAQVVAYDVAAQAVAAVHVAHVPAVVYDALVAAVYDAQVPAVVQEAVVEHDEWVAAAVHDAQAVA